MTSSPESKDYAGIEKQKEVLDDNARKFITPDLDASFLKENGARGFLLITDWLETCEDNEKKLAYKKFDDGVIQILLITKVTKDGRRTSEKEKISEAQYAKLICDSICHLEKMRYEFEYLQGGIAFDAKYDEFNGSTLRILEVDSQNDAERESFDPSSFPGDLSEVTGQLQYYGYRVTATV